MILSAEFWPTFREEKLELPEVFQKSLDVYTKSFEALKGNRTLNWKNHLGTVNQFNNFTSTFFIVIEIRWKFHFALNSVLRKGSLQNFAHATTAVLSWHVLKFVVIWLQQGKISTQFLSRIFLVTQAPDQDRNSHEDKTILRPFHHCNILILSKIQELNLSPILLL